MMLPFRFHRGEFFTGYFISNLMTYINNLITGVFGVYDELAYWVNVQFTLSPTGTQIAMRNNDITGIAAIAGIFPLYFSGGYWSGVFQMSESYVVNGSQRSERGLYDTANERFDYVDTGSDTYPQDIVTQASPTMKMSMVPQGTPVVGYVAQGAALFNEDGSINTSVIQSSPPVGVAYDVFYGPNFSTLSMDALIISKLGIELTYEMVVIMQQIRFGGPTLALFLQLTEFICQDAVISMSFAQGTYGAKNYYVVNYTTNTAATVSLPLQRIQLWAYIVGQKFKLYQLNEVV